MAITSAPSFFTPIATDQSMQYLNRIFGTMTIPTDTSAGLLPGPNLVTVLSYMFQTFNMIILSVGSLIIIYMTVVGVMMTAHEGEFMKKWNNLWGPIRAVFGIALLFPTTTGFSTIQIIMMWGIIQGIGAADTLWNSALRYTTVMGSVYATLQAPTSGIQQNMENMFKALVCERTASRNDALPVEVLNGQGAYYCNLNPRKPFCNTNQSTDVSSGYFQFGPEGGCGKMHTCDVNKACDMSDPNVAAEAAESPNGISDTCQKCKDQAAALSDIMGTLRSLADLIAYADYLYLDSFYLSYHTELRGSVYNHIVPDSDHLQPAWITSYCAAKGLTTGEGDIGYNSSNDNPAECHGTVNYNYVSKQKSIKSGGLASQTSSEVIEANLYRGALPDAQLGEGSPVGAVMSDIIWPYVIFPSLKLHTPGKYVSDPKDPNTDNPIGAAAQEYSARVGIPPAAADTNTQAVQGVYAQIDQTQLTGPLLRASQAGWIQAGAYYYQLVADNSSKLKHAVPTFEVIALNPAASGEGSGTGQPDTMKTSRNNYVSAMILIGVMSGNQSGQYGAANTDFLTSGSDAVGNMMYSATNPNTGTNPLVQVATAGYYLLLTATIIFGMFVLLTFLFGIVSGLDFFVLGTGANNPMSTAGPMIWMILVPLMAGLLGLMISMGATLGVYVPLIPYTIFAFGALGWLTSTIEAMVAGPIVALGILAPGGHHEMLGKAEPALMLLFGIAMRPVLMIFGLIAAMLLASVAVDMINATFWPIVVPQLVITAAGGKGSALTNQTAINAAMTFNPLMMIMFLIAYVGLIVSILNKAFAAIHIIPERVMRWIHGGQGDSHGEGEAAAGLKQSVAGGASAAGSAAGQGVKGAKDMKETEGKVFAQNDQIRADSGGKLGGPKNSGQLGGHVAQPKKGG